MPSLIFDIETVGENFDELDGTTQGVLTRWIEQEAGEDEGAYAAALADLKDGLGFSPLTGQIVAIGVIDAERDSGGVYFQAPGEAAKEWEEEGFTYRIMGEKEMLEKFWELAGRYTAFITFNGRQFDVPYLLLRSAVHKVKPTKDLMSNRYLSSQRFDAKHVDLYDQLTFYGALRRHSSLHMFCRAFGIPSPKAGGVTGDDVAGLFREKKFTQIAQYNARDLASTKALYHHWRQYLTFNQ